MSRFKIPTSKNTKSNNDDDKVLLDELIDMIKVFPNNYELGKKIREYVNDLKND
jgi:hypothetical protein